MNYVLSDEKRKVYNAHRPESKQSAVCYAPLSSLYFGIGGWVTSCCVNRSYVLGEYPKNSIREIWDSAKRSEMAERMQCGDLSRGCQVCYDAIESGNFSGVSAKVYDELSDTRVTFPKKMDFELSNKCNLECIICRGERSSSIRKNREKLPPIESPYDDEFIKQLEAFFPYLEDCHFLGGEPFLIPIYLDIWERMIEINPNINVSLQTNGTILTDRVKRILESLPFSISVSIDSVEHDNYAKVRVNGNFDTVLKNMAYFKEYCTRKGTEMTISYTPMLKNWKELPKVVEFCNDWGVKVFFNTLSYPKHLALMNLEAEELERIVKYLKDYRFSTNSNIELTNATSYEDMVNLVEYWYDESKKRSVTVNVSPYHSLDAFFEAFRAYLNAISGDPELTYVEVRSKVEAILTIAEEGGKYQLAEDFIMALDFDKLYRYVPGVSLEELLVSFERSVAPLREV